MILAASLILALALRLLLAAFNQESNDPHLPVAEIIAFEGRLPEPQEAWEAFQPSLYYLTVGGMFRLLDARDHRTQTLIAQIINSVAGIAIVGILWHLTRRHTTTLPTALAFAAVALNPALTGISGQATNDVFVILFGTIALLFGVRYFSRWRARDYAGLLVAAIGAGLSKGNGLVVILAVIVTFAVSLVRARWTGFPGRARVALSGVMFLLLVVPLVAHFGRYGASFQELGTPFATNWQVSPAPHPFRETFVERPGLTSLAHGLLTFRLLDLLRHPESNFERDRYPRHRTSLWTRLYAQAHSTHFEAWPPSWKARQPWMPILTRALFLLGLVPTAILLIGLCLLCRNALPALGIAPAGRDSRLPGGVVLLAVAAAGYLAFAATYAIRLRDYSSMKVIFILPAVAAFVIAFLRGVAWCSTRLMRWPNAIRALNAILALLTLAYAADAIALITDL